MLSHQQFLESLGRVHLRINEACREGGRERAEVELMAVTKTHPPEAADWALAAGLRHIGENRVQEAADKRSQVKASGFWELIGPLQRNKARLAVESVDRIQTVDRIKLVDSLDRICGELGKASYPVLLQANVGEDPAKHGCADGEAERLMEAILGSRHLELQGLMTIGELTDDERIRRGTFARLRMLRDRLSAAGGLPLPVLSMGMTDDLEWAIEEGSTMIRVGSALFGAR